MILVASKLILKLYLLILCVSKFTVHLQLVDCVLAS